MTKTEEIMELVTDYGSECLSYGIELSPEGNADDRLLVAQDKDIALFKLKAAIEELAKDAERFAWALPMLSGDDDTTADKRTLALGMEMVRGLNGREAIDAAMEKTP